MRFRRRVVNRLLRAPYRAMGESIAALATVGQKSARGAGRLSRGLIVLVLGLAVLLSACGGGVPRHESWPGLIVHEGTVYAANYDAVQAFNAETGKLLWSYTGEDEKSVAPFYSKPVLAADYGEYGVLLAAGFSNRTVYALKLGESPAERPDPLWTFSEATGQYVGSGTVADSKFLIGNGDGRVYALSLEDGSKVWDFATRDRVWATPVVVDDVVYIASLDHTLYAVDLATGQEQWRLELNGAIAATPVLAEGDLWVGDFSSQLSQVDLETRSVVWQYDARSWLWATPVVDGGTLYFSDVEGHVYALDLGSHALLWDEPTQVEDVLHGRPAVSPDGDLLFVPGHEKGSIHVLDATNGLEMNWGPKLRDPGRLPGDLVLDEGRLYAMPILIGTRVRVLDLETGRILWTYPSEVEEQ